VERSRCLIDVLSAIDELERVFDKMPLTDANIDAVRKRIREFAQGLTNIARARRKA
jgi:hypothetical protein